MLRWKKNGCVAHHNGMRNVKTGELRPLTLEEEEKFIQEFKGKEFLEEPITRGE